MGSQASSISLRMLPHDTMDSLQFEIKKQVHIYSEINNLAYDDFQKCLADLNRLARKCLDADGKQLVFAVKKGTDNSILWKRTVRIACVKIHPETRKIDCYKLLTLQQFLQVFRTIQTNLHAMVTVESQRIHSPTKNQVTKTLAAGGVSSSLSTVSINSSRDSVAGLNNESVQQPANVEQPGSSGHAEVGTTSPQGVHSTLSSSPTSSSSTSSVAFLFPETAATTSMLMAQVDAVTATVTGSVQSTNDENDGPVEQNECCICLERKPEVSLPCAHSYCMPCIEQWNIHQKTCPICDEELATTDDTWVLSEMPEADEVSEEICATLMKLSNDSFDEESDKKWWRRMLNL
ncbi:LON peptidase N-terminal domain and RING finger protein 3-like [Anopheles aquasalis]|uniref:LON peptidase N-terminal domain and RING finger protein 3-like n=1 Tax=Anopheles aquasalis TaxID=42839 RepID=UPI00215A70AB|nr:LON peptidase N-terminal domain and RING finger protein 3-like [Anopheles aquasalis]